jgi:HK97 family phage major capsid protein
VIKQSSTDRRALLGRLTLELTNKRGPLTEGEKLKVRSLRAEMDELESDIGAEHNRKYRSAFTKGLRFGFDNNALTRDESETISSMTLGKRELEKRDMQIGVLQGSYPGAQTGIGAGDVFVPLEMAEAITSTMRDVGPMFRVSTILDTQSAALRPYPVDNDSTIFGERLENQAASLQDIADLGQIVLSGWQYSSRIIRLSTSLAQDFGYDIEAYLSERFGSRIARIANQEFTIGTGSTDAQPMGFVTAAVNAGGTVTAVGSAPNDSVGGPSSIGVDDLANLEAALDPMYRMSPSCAWQMHPSTLQALRKVKDKVGNNCFPGLHGSGEDTIYGYRVLMNPAMDQLPTNASSPALPYNTVALSDWSRYIVRRAPPLLSRLKTRWVEFGQIGYILWWRMDGNLPDTNAIKILRNIF